MTAAEYLQQFANWMNAKEGNVVSFQLTESFGITDGRRTPVVTYGSSFFDRRFQAAVHLRALDGGVNSPEEDAELGLDPNTAMLTLQRKPASNISASSPPTFGRPYSLSFLTAQLQYFNGVLYGTGTFVALILEDPSPKVITEQGPVIILCLLQTQLP